MGRVNMSMRLNELIGKEVINLTDANRLGVVRNAQALIDTETGRVEALLVPYADRQRRWRVRQRLLAIPWRAIRRLGRDLIIVEVKTPAPEEHRRSTITIKSD